jgi:hypothetical protein
MKTILRRKEGSSIFCPPVHQRNTIQLSKAKSIELSIACTMLVVGFFIIMVAQ